MIQLSVILPTHNPAPARLHAALEGLRNQTLAAAAWELIVVDNASDRPLERDLDLSWHPNARVVPEPRLGLTHARRRGFSAAAGEQLVLVDDDNVLAPEYLERVTRRFAAHANVGAGGGRVIPAFEREPDEWQREFLPLLALRDLGPEPMVSAGLRSSDGRAAYPSCAPVGAGMALRRAAVAAWVASDATLPDRSGRELSSAGDNDIVLSIMRAGWEVAYFPELTLTHLIPATRLDPRYLARLNRGIQQSWMQVLIRHDVSPWPPLSRAGAMVRQTRAWFTYRAWRYPVGYIRWQGACGHFQGRCSPVHGS